MTWQRSTARHRRRPNGIELLEARAMLTATLAISEINYAPYEPVPAFGDIVDSSASDYEFIELVNTGAEPLELQGIQFRRVNVGGNNEGVDFTFDAGTLGPQERIVVVEDLIAFRARYGDGPRVAGEWAGGLGNDSELLTLLDTDGSMIEQMTYRSDSGWPSRAAGLGATLENVALENNPNDPDNWQSSIEYGGTPGTTPGDRSETIVFNEILAHTDLPQIDTVELYNLTGEPVDLSGWFMSDNIQRPFVFSLAAGSIIPANGYFQIYENEFNPGDGTLPNDFALSEFGDELWLISADASGRPDKFIDRVNFGATLNGVSVGNVPNGDTAGDLQPLAALTLGQPNGGHRVSDVVVNEVQYHPPDDDVYKEFIELVNTTVFEMSLDDWAIDDAVGVTVPAGTTIPRLGTLVLVAFDPAETTRSAAFREYYGISDNVKLVGPWGTDKDGQPDALSNGGEKITLTLPTFDPVRPEPWPVLADQVDYNDRLPWPEVADGQGGSIQRIAINLYGNAPESWHGIQPSPGNEPIDVNDSPEVGVDAPLTAEIGLDGTLVRGAADVDLYRFTPAESGEYELRVEGVGDVPMDPFLRIFASDGTELAWNDNLPESTASGLALELDAGTEYYVSVSGSSPLAREFDPWTGTGLAAGSTGTYTLTIQQALSNPSPWKNHDLPEDVTGDGAVVPLDALLIINELNGEGARPLPVPPDPNDLPPPFLDVDGDNFLAPIDALLVINYLNAQAALQAAEGNAAEENTAEGEFTPQAAARVEPTRTDLDPCSRPTPHRVPSDLIQGESLKTLAAQAVDWIFQSTDRDRDQPSRRSPDGPRPPDGP